MKVGHDDFGGGDTFALVYLHRNAAAIVHDGDGAIGIETHIHGIAIAGQRFVDRIVDDFIDHVMKAGPVIRIADIHAGALAHGIEALEDLDRFRTIFFRCSVGGIGHLAFLALFEARRTSGQTISAAVRMILPTTPYSFASSALIQ